MPSKTLGAFSPKAGIVAAAAVRQERCRATIVGQVHPKWRGRGLGAALLSEVLRRFRDAGSTEVSLDINVNSPTARRLYDRLHFVQIGRRARYTRQDNT